MPSDSLIVGLDVGGTAINATVLTGDGRFPIDHLIELPSRVLDGPAATLDALAEAYHAALNAIGSHHDEVIAVGLDTPGPASADGVISAQGATNFALAGWRGYHIRRALEERLDRPVVYSNDANAAAVYAHYQHFGERASHTSSASAIIGTGLGGGIVHHGQIIAGGVGMAGELGHVHIPPEGILRPDQPIPVCNCGFHSDVESYASLSGIRRNLLPYWLTVYPDHHLHDVDLGEASMMVRGLAERDRDPLAMAIFTQQAAAIGALFTIMGNIVDPDAFFVGGGIVETEPWFRQWFLGQVRDHTQLRDEQAAHISFEIVADLDMAGARGAALAARDAQS